MGRRAGAKHEYYLSSLIEEYEKKGWRVVRLQEKSPDAVACKNGKLIALEVLGVARGPKGGELHSWTYKAKKATYDMFDDLIIKTFFYD